jgi:adenine-specific DNA-methyltransferase
MSSSAAELPGQSSLGPIFAAIDGQDPSVELARRVRLLAGSKAPEALERALQIELARLGEAFEAEPDAWAAWADGIDVVGAAFEDLLPGAVRRAAGQFLTPHWAADLMAAWLLQEPVRLLCDPAVGSGRLLYRADQRPEAGPDRYVGFDIDESCLAMAELNLRMRGLRKYLLEHRNFLLDDVGIVPDAVTCNPPYSRHHTIDPDEKVAIYEGFARRLGLRLSRLAGLHVLFLIRALEIAAPGGRLAFITPAEWLDVNYGREVKRFVLDQAHVEALVIFKDDHLFFDGALTTAAITLIRKRGGDHHPSGKTRILHLPAKLPDVEAVLAALSEKGQLRADAVQLDSVQKWSRKPASRGRGRPLGELARVRRGIATGCNRFFVLSEATRRARGLAPEDLRPCITSPRLVEGLEIGPADLDALDDETPRWVIDSRDPGAESSETPLGRYLRWGRDELEAHAGYLARKRQPWYAMERRGDSPILFTYMNRERPRFIRNRVGAVPLNTFLIVEPYEGVDPEQLWKTLSSPDFLRQVQAERRSYGGGLWKLEPKELEALPVPLEPTR